VFSREIVRREMCRSLSTGVSTARSSGWVQADPADLRLTHPLTRMVLTPAAQHQPRCQRSLFLISAPRRIECPAQIVESKLQRSRPGPQFGTRCRFKFAIPEGTRPQLVSSSREFQHAAKQDSFRGVRANMIIADAREVAIFRSNDADTLDRK